ncbi:hypothetical protein [Desulforamulus profundi]|nr:hypothetical protein [Desulforamulus profundi]
MGLLEMLHSFAVVFGLLGTLLLLIHSFSLYIAHKEDSLWLP